MKLRWLAFPALVVGLALASSSASASTPDKPIGGETWEARWAVLEPHARRLEEQTNWPGLTEYLRVVAWMESKGSLTAVHDGGIGRGPFALHATTSSVQAIGGMAALSMLEDPRVAVATAASHAYRLTRGTYHYPRSDTRWSDIRAGWALPHWTGDRNAPPWRSFTRPAVVARFVQRAKQLGASSMPNAIALGSVHWPGLRAALVILDSPHAAHVDPASAAA